MSFKRSQPGLRFATEKVSPDEMDAYTVYNIVNPSTTALGTLFVASGGTAGTAAEVALVVNNKYPDYPRNVAFNIHGTGAALGGTLKINGNDQFGSGITESITFSKANNGGTGVGTKVFGQFTGGTLYYGTAVGDGTPNIGLDGGTSCLFGLPCKIGGTSDIVHMSMSQGTGPITVGGGTAIGSLVDKNVHAVRPFAALGGTSFMNVWVKSTYNGEEAPIAAGTQMA